MITREKVASIFRDLVAERSSRLDAGRYLADVNSRITQALSTSEEETEVLRKDGVGFHLIDWQADAAFLVALALYPERFTDEEIREGVESFLIHVPSHVVEAARLAQVPINTVAEDEDKNA